MGKTRALRAIGSAMLAGALVVGSAPTASADQIRDDQWALRAFEAEKVWKESTGQGVIVAVLDSAVNGSHPDLRENVLPGMDMLTGGPANQETRFDHGTAVASVIAAHGHGPGNNNGVVGLAPEAKILPVRIATKGDSPHLHGSEMSYAKAIRYAVDQGASVINMSIGAESIKPEEEEALAYAANKDVLVVSSSGNEGRVNYPARMGSVVAVGAIDEAGNIWEDSSGGRQVMLSAPGDYITAAAVIEPYREFAGTSYASAYVSGAAALLRAKFPNLTAGQIVNRLTKTALLPDRIDAPDGHDSYYGYGMIRPYRALTENIPPGPRSGPLEIPKPPKSDPEQGAAGAVAPGGGDAVEDDLTSGQKAILGGVVVLFLGTLVALLVASAVKKKRRSAPAPLHPGVYGAGSGYPVSSGVPPHVPGSYQGQGPAHGGYPPVPPNHPPTQ
ncbi:S8 family serine peptidase [Streptomyces alkaliterrae]|uniref:S8 family serine peptidase n=1 Tax=Streptomyces alkaliterrae TaxID=2213162 RepID=A0A5P0YZ67_9ACTN|nr:S8 family serine peptidase [Streptomyces alkaliterrae]MBB1261240.1 S8 family serine peptidase [Streptomyces alkaliterrae]MQS04847.1 S8 family serine peptidase [Streptomyces alkaliterrae]